MSLQGTTAFITGATSGFGRACAERLSAEGARIVALGRRGERLDELKRALAGRAVHAVILDVRDRAAVEAAVAGLPTEFADIGILVNNAGLALGLEPFPKASMADFEQMIDTNIKGVIYCTHALLPGMIARGHGHVVNIGSVAGSYPYPGGHVYGGTKAFIKQCSLSLRADLLGTPVRVTNIEPGMAETEFSLVRYHGDAPKAEAVYAGVEPLSAADVAESVLWCVTRPAHVNINRIELMPVQQASGGFAVSRRKPA